MANVWDPDFELDAVSAHALIENEFPSFGSIEIEPMGVGWDNIAYLVNRQFVFRFPRRSIAVRLLENEVQCLRSIAQRLTVRVPYPEFVAAPTSTTPCPFAGYRLIPGATACRAGLTDSERASLAKPIGAFIGALHKITVNDNIRATFPSDELRRSEVQVRRGRVLDNLVAAAPHVPNLNLTIHAETIEHLAKTSQMQSDAVCIVHGDLYARHIVVDDSRRLSGIIDWGDVHVGDPALDLSIAFSFLPAAARTDFRESYGAIDEDTWKRAQFRAIHYGALLTDYGAKIGDEAIRKAGEYALRNAI